FSLGNVVEIFKPVGRVENVVAEILPGRAVEAVGTRLDGGVEHGGAGAAKLSTEAGGLHLELLDGFQRRKHNVVGSVQEIHGVGIVVNAVQHVVVLRRPIAVGREVAGGRVTASVRLRRI